MSHSNHNSHHENSSNHHPRRTRTHHSYNCNKRPHRHPRKAVDEFNYYTHVSKCHHCNSSLPSADLFKCSNSFWNIEFWLPCLRRYFITAKKKTFETQCKRREFLCLVCKRKCLWRKCQKLDLQDDMKVIKKLIEEQEKAIIKSEEGKLYSF